ncbi:MAG TPA: MFS transporter, partial [Caulobacteraceae bacterium]|nr:MFS transporter [Caulobacteraceae bacterium]
MDEALREERVREIAGESPGEALGVTSGPSMAPYEIEAAVAADASHEREAVKPFSSLIPAIIGSAMLMQTLNATVLSNALPTMAHSLGEDPVHLSTAITVYLLASAVFLPISGWAADKFGAKRVFMAAIALYAIACAACGFAQNLAELLAARVFQGAAGAMMA